MMGFTTLRSLILLLALAYHIPSTWANRNPVHIDLYPPISLIDEDDGDQQQNFLSSRNFPTQLLRLGAAGTGLFAGIKLWQFCRKIINDNKMHNNKTSVIIGQSILSDDLIVPLNGTDQIDPSMVSSQELVDLKKDQEELWRIVHNIYEKQSDKITQLDGTYAELQISNEAVGKSVSDVRAEMSLIATTLQSIEVRLRGMEEHPKSGLNENNDLIASNTNVALEQDVKKLGEALDLLRLEMEDSIQKRDERLLARIKKFGEDLKQLIREERKSKSDSKADSKKIL